MIGLAAEGRVEHQKWNQTGTVCGPFGFVFGVQYSIFDFEKSALHNLENRIPYVLY